MQAKHMVVNTKRWSIALQDYLKRPVFHFYAWIYGKVAAKVLVLHLGGELRRLVTSSSYKNRRVSPELLSTFQFLASLTGVSPVTVAEVCFGSDELKLCTGAAPCTIEPLITKRNTRLSNVILFGRLILGPPIVLTIKIRFDYRPIF